jgi:hypothetical protein
MLFPPHQQQPDNLYLAATLLHLGLCLADIAFLSRLHLLVLTGEESDDWVWAFRVYLFISFWDLRLRFSVNGLLNCEQREKKKLGLNTQNTHIHRETERERETAQERDIWSQWINHRGLFGTATQIWWSCSSQEELLRGYERNRPATLGSSLHDNENSYGSLCCSFLGMSGHRSPVALRSRSLDQTLDVAGPSFGSIAGSR